MKNIVLTVALLGLAGTAQAQMAPLNF